MSDQEINELRKRISALETLTKHLSVRSTISLNLLSALSDSICHKHNSDVFREVLTAQVENFSYQSEKVDADIVEAEKKTILGLLNSVTLPKSE